MGNYFQKQQSTPFPCQKCADIFQRMSEGSLFCEECMIVENFDHLNDQDKYEVVVPSIIFPMFTFIKNKSTLVHIQMDISNPREDSNTKDIENPKLIIEKIKSFRLENLIFRKKYRLIKRFIYYIHSIGYLKTFSGIFIHTKYSNDILFIHDRNIKDKDRIIFLNIDDMINKMKQKII